MLWLRKKRKDPEIDPDEIFLDASNAPDFDRSRFEGRLERPLSQATFFSLFGVLTFLMLVLVGRSWNLQISQGADFAEQSAHNSLAVETIFAPRGIITDVHGVVLAENIVKEDGLPGQGSSVIRNYPVPSLSQVIGYVSYPKKDAKGVYYK